MTACELFQKIAGQVWDEISRNHARGNRLIEEGITRSNVIGTIQDYVDKNSRYDVFAQKAINEVTTGADLEIYIQSGYNEYYRLMIQAKIVDLDGNFHDIDRESGSSGRKQYDSLLSYGNTINSQTFYLFYNGIPDFQETFKDCAGLHNERQFGCAIIKATEVKTHCEINKTGTISGLPSSRPLGTPWRLLTCCENPLVNPNNFKSYSREEIDMDPYFNNLFTTPPPIGFIISGQQPRRNGVETLNRQIHESGWKPSARIIVGKKRMHLRDGVLRQNW